MEMSTRDEDMFFQSTQPQEDETDKDDVYLVLAKAITERKCKIDQKIEKLKLIISEEKELNEELKAKIEMRKCEKKDIKEVISQKRLRVMTIKNTKESQATVEKTLNDLNTKVALKIEEIKKKRYEYQLQIKDIHQTWLSYKEKYENFPIARQVKDIMVDKRKLEIELKNVKLDISDIHERQKLKNDIAGKRFYVRAVKLAQLYFSLQAQIAEKNLLQEKLKHLKSQHTDNKCKRVCPQVKAPKAETCLLSTKDQGMIQDQSKFLDFKIPDLKIPSPTPSDNVEESSGISKSFSWGSLFSSLGKFSFSSGIFSKTEKRSDSTPTHKQSSLVNTVSKLHESCKEVMNGGGNLSSTLQFNKSSNNVLNSGKKVENKSTLKRSLEIDDKGKENKQDEIPSKKLDSKTFQQIIQVSGLDRTLIKTKELTQEISLQENFFSQERENPIENSSIGSNKEDMLHKTCDVPLKSKNISPSLKNITDSNNLKTVPLASLPLTQNLLNTAKTHGDHTKTKEHQVNVAHKQISCTLPMNHKSNMPSSQKKFDSREDICKISNTDMIKKHPHNIIIEMEPLSPVPDVIPVENNSQTMSQGSQESREPEYSYSTEPDESAKQAYQRMDDEYPVYDYASAPYMNLQNSNLEPDGELESHYFEEDSTNNPVGQYPASPPFSPIATYEDDSQAANGILSPPPGNLSSPEGGASVSTNENPNNRGFNFSFMSGSSSEKKKSSIFNLF